ncbi:MAG: citrate lyase acyl carrier protein, partial [Lachnospiraceae bacterium]|nr:citrate lyase acyl carrier protein [Lachnospiraceae bacterium]
HTTFMSVSWARRGVSETDKGALDCTIRARIECAVFRAAGQTEHLPWGGVLR